MNNADFVGAPQSTQPGTPNDKIARTLRMVGQNVFLAVFALVPIFFIPIAFAPFEYSKILLIVIGVMVSLIFFSLSVLRTGVLSVSSPISLLLFWLIPVSAALSALLSGDVRDALVGDTFSTQSAAFLALLALVATSVVLVLNKKQALMRFYMLLLGVSLVLGLYHIIRLLFGGTALSFGVFTNTVSTPLGDWNDLAMFFGLAVILSLITLEQLPLAKMGRAFLGGLITIALIILAVVNFYAVWLVVGVVSLIMVIYSLSKDRFGGGVTTFAPGQSGVSSASVVASIAVFIVAFLFVIGGSAVGSVVSNMTGISYIEVRPSISATADIARHVYSESAFMGIGPNKFVDAWRLYKDPSINQTAFWNTDFATGNGYITTLFVTTGVLGVLAWLVFFVAFLRTGARMVFASQLTDRILFYLATTSLIATVYLWGLSIFYVPSAAILLLAALFTGISLTVAGMIHTKSTKQLVFGRDKRTGFVLVTVVMLIIIGSVTAMFMTGRHYAASYVFAHSLGNIADGVSLDEIEQGISNAYDLSQSDRYARQVAQYQIARMNTLLTLTDPTTEQQQQFQAAVANGINAAQLAVDIDGTDAMNWGTLGMVYSTIAQAGVEGAYERANEAFTQARIFDPVNPSYAYAQARLESRAGNLEEARAYIEEAIRMRPQFTEAVYFLSQLDVAAGDIDAAIKSTRASVSLEPNNPSRYYQLGILYSSNSQLAEARQAFERAVALNPNFANARYFLALAYVEEGRTEDALAQLQVVQELNPDNTELQTLMDQISSGAPLPSATTTAAEAVTEPAVVGTEGETVTSSELPDTNLITTDNPSVAGNGTGDEGQAADTGTESTPDTTEAPTTTDQTE